MSDTKTYTVQDLRAMLGETLRKEMRDWEHVLVSLRKRELAKDDGHYEPGNHETPGTGVAPHIEPGVHEQHSFGPGGLQAQHAPDPVGSDSGVPMNGQPPDSTPGGEIGGADACPMCNQPDLPGSCQCLAGAAPTGGGDVDGFDRPDADLGADADLGGGELRMSEKPLAKAQKRKVTAFQVRKLASKGKDTKKGEDTWSCEGCAHTVGDSKIKDFNCPKCGGEMNQDHPHPFSRENEAKRLASKGKDTKKGEKAPDKATELLFETPEPKVLHPSDKKKSKPVKKNAVMGYGGGGPGVSSEMGQSNVGQGDISGATGLAQSEPLDKDLASATAELRTQNKLLNAANQIRAPKFGLGDKKPMGQKFTKEEWIDIANEGDPVKRLKNFPEGSKETAVPASTTNKGAEKRGQGVDVKTVEGATSEAYPVSGGVNKKFQAKGAGVQKAEVPSAKPPSGKDMATHVPKATVKLPKVPGMAKGAAPLGSMIQPGSSTPAGVVKGESAPEKHQKKIAAQDAKMPKPMKDVMSPAPVKKAAMPANKQMAMQASADAHKAHVAGGAPAPAAPKLPGMAEQDQRAQMYADFMPKPAGPSVPGLKAPPKLPGMGKPLAKPIFGKAEMNDLKCSMCKGTEHPGDCK